MDRINHKDRVVVSIPAGKLDEFQGMVVEMLKSNVIPGKRLRTLAGKASHFASLLFIWCQFLSKLWGAQEAQVQSTLGWFLAFLEGRRKGALQLTYRVDAYKNGVVTDTCVFGLCHRRKRNLQDKKWEPSTMSKQRSVSICWCR